MAYTPDLNPVFIDGHTLQLKTDAGSYAECRLQVQQIGELTLTTGRIAACDPLTMWGTIPFERAVAPGRYAVLLTTAHYIGGDKREAYASVQFRPEKPVRWEMALNANAHQDMSNLGEKQFFGYGVNSSTGCFMDEQGIKLLKSRLYREAFGDTMRATMKKTLDTTGFHAGDFVVDVESGMNVVTFHCGNNGINPSFWGFDDRDNVVCLTTDFCLFSDEDEQN